VDENAKVLLEPLLQTLARGDVPTTARWIKRSRLRDVLWIPTGEAGAVFVKRDRTRRILQRARFLPSRAAREYTNLQRVRALGVQAVEPLAWQNRRRLGGVDESWLVTRELPQARVLRDVSSEVDSGVRLRLVRTLARVARRLHDHGFWHRDLHAGNVLVAPHPETGLPRLVLVDLQKLRVLPVPVPWALRVRDLAFLLPASPEEPETASGQAIAEAYLGEPPARSVEQVGALVERAAMRRRRRRLRSRGRRCVVPSTGFRIDVARGRRVFRRADVGPEVVDAALQAHLEATGADGSLPTRVEGLRGGPPPGPSARPFQRGQGGDEVGSPALAPVTVTAFAGAGLRGGSHPGMRAWRGAHALLLRGFDTPAPLALVEERRLGWVSRSFLVARWEDVRGLSELVAGSQSPRARSGDVAGLGRFLGLLHESGLWPLEIPWAAIGVRPSVVGEGDSHRFVVLEPQALRSGAPPDRGARVSALARFAAGATTRHPELARRSLLARMLLGYAEAAGLPDGAWRSLFTEIARELARRSSARGTPGGKIRYPYPVRRPNIVRGGS
jgi:tRNA A-37 threonylcarbamoyl transferase component Bud32